MLSMAIYPSQGAKSVYFYFILLIVSFDKSVARIQKKTRAGVQEVLSAELKKEAKEAAEEKRRAERKSMFLSSISFFLFLRAQLGLYRIDATLHACPAHKSN